MPKTKMQLHLENLGEGRRLRAREKRLAEMAKWVGVHEKNTKLIPLGKNQFAKVDADMHADLDRWNWHVNRNGYVVRFVKRCLIGMHAVVCLCVKPLAPDHRNRNKLDNRRENLRPATKVQNQGNRWKSSQAKTSRFKGVYYCAEYRRFRAYGREKETNKCLGSFQIESDAARAYNRWASKYFGEFALLNPV